MSTDRIQSSSPAYDYVPAGMEPVDVDSPDVSEPGNVGSPLDTQQTDRSQASSAGGLQSVDVGSPDVTQTDNLQSLPESTQQAGTCQSAKCADATREAFFDPNRDALQADRLGLKGEGAERYTPAWQSLEEFYAESPEEVARLDAFVDGLREAFKAGLQGQSLSPEASGEQREALDQMMGALEGLVEELGKEGPDPQRVGELTRQADQALLEWASAGDADLRERMRQHYGDSLRGGGALGNEIGDGVRTRALTPQGYDGLDAARTGAYLRDGSQGEQVVAFQRALNQAGHTPPLPEDGVFDATTEQAVRAFQAQNGCKVDGVVGPETLGALDVRLGLPRRSARGGMIGPMNADVAAAVGQAPSVAPGQTNRLGALAAAQTQIGVREASGNNDGVPAQRYSGGQNVPWCANFVTWAFEQAGTPLPGKRSGYVPYIESQMKQQGTYWTRDQGQPQAGDLIFFGRPPGRATHIGIVESVSNGQVTTVEGNTGNRVARRTYPLGSSKIRAYGRP